MPQFERLVSRTAVADPRTASAVVATEHVEPMAGSPVGAHGTVNERSWSVTVASSVPAPPLFLSVMRTLTTACSSPV